MSVMWFLSAFLLIIVVNGEPDWYQPGEKEIFAALVEDLDTTDLLFTCDFMKTHKYLCNVTRQGVSFLKRDRKPTKKESPTPVKTALYNVMGEWSDTDGIMKPNYKKGDYNLMARCFFRVSYYECFGVPRCDKDQPRGMSPCSGGEPWRGLYEGAPNSGFRGNITAQAMETSALQPDSERVVDPSELPADYAANATVNNPDPDQPYEADTPGPVGSLNQPNSTPKNQSGMIVKEFSNVDNKTGIVSKGAVAVIPDKGTVMVVHQQTYNRTFPGGRVGAASSAAISSRSSSSSSSVQMSDGQGNNIFIDQGEPGQSVSVGAGAVSSSSSDMFPRQSLFPSWFQTGNTGFGSLFGNIFDQIIQPSIFGPSSFGANPASFIDTVPPQTPHRPTNTSGSADPCTGQSALSCMVRNFQQTVTNNILSSLSRTFSSFGNANTGSMSQQQGISSNGGSMFQQQNGPVAQSRMLSSSNVRQVAQPQSNPFGFFGNMFSNNDNQDDWFRFRK